MRRVAFFYMIFISSNSADRSTLKILNWLAYYDAESTVLYGDQECLDKVEFHITNDGASPATPVLRDARAWWYRRNCIAYDLPSSFYGLTAAEEAMVKAHLQEEFLVYKEYFYSLLAGLPTLNQEHNASVNKLQVLEQASKAGLLIPDSLVCTTKESLQKFLQKHKQVITKPLSGPVRSYGTSNYILYTELLDTSILENLPESFFPSFFQKCIQKQFEVRAFYLDGDWHCLAMFTQANEKTRTDSRKYSTAAPTRMIPFALPADIKTKTASILKSLDLQTASVDFIVDKDDTVYFLEINPVGQFGEHSYVGNFYLEKKIAKKLATYERGR